MLPELLIFALQAEVVVPNLDGKPVAILPTRARHGMVAFFVIADCPIANAYVPEMNRIASDYGRKGFDFRLVFVDAHPSMADLKSQYAEFRYAFPAHLDSERRLVGMAGATKSPEAAVFSQTGTLLYVGRIDDRYYALGKKRPKPTTYDLRRSLDAILAGRPVPKTRTKTIGCFLPKP